MNELPPPTPLPPPVDDDVADPRSLHRIQNPVALFLTAATLSVLTGGVTGGVVGFSIGAAANADCSATDPWCELGGAIYGFLGGVLVGLTVYLVVGIATIHRCRPRGERAPHIAAHIVTPVAVPALLALLANGIPT